MPTKFLCPNAVCGKSSLGPETLIGKSVRCKHCSQSFIAQATVDNQASDTHEKSSRPSSASIEAATPNIGRFVIRKKLGAGAFGTVYRAYDPQLDREVAIKLPNAGVLDNPRRIERFLREARAAANLRHPNIVPVFESGKIDDRFFIASAFIDGQPLDGAIEDGGMSVHRSARLTRELAEALAYAHEQGVVHRDVKPANCLVDKQDRLHLTDFGLAARTAELDKLTSDGAILGTPSYMAPEIAAGQKGEAHPAADQFAVGVVLYELLTGRTPFEGPPATVLYQVQHSAPPSPRTLRPDVPKDLETICLKAMAKQPGDRYPDCSQLADDLHRWQEGQPVHARRLGLGERAVRWLKREPKLAFSLLAAVGGLLLAATIGTVAAIWLSISADRLAKANNEAQASANAAREQEQIALASAKTAREAEAARAKEAEIALQAKAKAEEAETKAKEAAENERSAKEEADMLRQSAETSLANERKAREQLVAEAILRKAAEEDAKTKDIGNQIKLANSQIEKAGYAEAQATLEKVAPEFREWEWRLLNEFAKANGKPFAELKLPIEKNTLYSLRFSGDLRKALVVNNDRLNHTELIVLDLENQAQIFRATVDGATSIDDVQRTSLSRDGQYLVHVVSMRLGNVPVASKMAVWDVFAKKLITPKDGYDFGVGYIALAAAFHPKLDQFVVAGEHNGFAWHRIFDASKFRQIAAAEMKLFGPIAHFGYRSDNQHLFLSHQKQIHWFDPLAKKLNVTTVNRQADKGELDGFVPFPPDRLLMWDKGVKLWGLTKNQVVGELFESEKLLWPTVRIFEDSKRIAGFTRDDNNRLGLKAWSVATGKPMLELGQLITFSDTKNPYAERDNKDKPIRLRTVCGFRDFAISPSGDRIVYRSDMAVRAIKVPEK